MAVAIAIDADGVPLAVGEAADQRLCNVGRARITEFFGGFLHLVRVLRRPPVVDFILQNRGLFFEIERRRGSGFRRRHFVDAEEVAHG